MKKLLLAVVFIVAPLAFAGCKQVPDRTIPPSYDETIDQQAVDEITQTDSDAVAADAALDATDKALDELDSIEFGEAPAVE